MSKKHHPTDKVKITFLKDIILPLVRGMEEHLVDTGISMEEPLCENMASQGLRISFLQFPDLLTKENTYPEYLLVDCNQLDRVEYDKINKVWDIPFSLFKKCITTRCYHSSKCNIKIVSLKEVCPNGMKPGIYTIRDLPGEIQEHMLTK